MGFSATAQAQTEVWSGTLTVKDLGNLLGCSNAIEGARCRDTAILTDDDFTYDSTDYVVHNLFLHVGPAGRLEISFIPDLATAAQALTLDVAGTKFAFEAADVKEERQRVWASTGLSWSGGDTVAVKLTETPTSTNNAPIFTDGTSTTRSVAENTTASTNIGTAIAATDADGGDTLRYTLGGTDMASFAIVSTSGQLQTSAAMDFETKSSYAVTVSVSDGNGGSDSISVTITVTDVNEQPGWPAAPSVGATANSDTSLDVSWTAPGLNGGPAITGYHLQYRQGTSGPWTNGPQNVSGTSTAITGLTAGTSYQVQVRALNGETPSDWSPAGTGTTTAAANNAPIFAEGTSTKRRVAENTAAITNIGVVVAARDADSGDTLRYTLGGTDAASFAIVSASGQLQTSAALDFETKSSYAVTVSVSDGNGGSDSIDVTIIVTDVAEKPATPAAPTVSATANSDTSLDVSWTAPGRNGGPAITGYNLRYRQGTSGSWTNGPQNVSGTSTMITGLTAGTSYQVQVRALNGETPSDWSPAGTGSTSSTAQPTLTLDVDPNRFSEAAGSVQICVVPSAVSSQRITVQVATADGTATAPGDYGAHSGTVALQPQQQQACFTVNLVDDADAEGDETFTVTLSNPVNATLGTPAVATFTIVDNDDTTVATDRAALVAFYNATGGANWTFNTNWLSNEPLSEWRGVTTNDDGRVTELDLRNNQLTGEIPEELSQLPQLESLALGSNRLKVEIPEELGQLSRLQRLDLRNNQLTGEIPEELAQLPQLETLNLSSNQLTGEIPAELSQLPQLESFALFGNQLTGEIPVELAQLPQLETLNLSSNQLTGEIPAELSQLPQLRNLYLFGNQLTGEIPVELAQLTQLESLALGSNQLTGEIPVELSQLSQLTGLSLDGNQLTGEIPVELSQLSQLTGLSLDGNQLTGEIPVELSQLPQLTYLDLSDNPLTGEIPAELAELSQLRHLYLFGNQLTGEIPEELAQLPQLETLDLSDNPLTGEIPVELSQLPQLRHLDLSRNQLTGKIPVELGGLTNLQKLYLSRNTLSGEIPEELGNLGSLQYLYLNDNQLTGEIPSWLVRLTQLRELALWGNQLTGTIPPEVAPAQDRAVLRVFYNATGGADWADNTAWLSNAPLSAWHGVITDADGRVTDLLFYDNQLTGTIPTQLGQLTELQYLNLNNNELSGTIPTELRRLTKLTGLDLGNNRLTGTIPTQLGQLTELRYLNLHDNQLTGTIPTQLGQLTKLTALYFDSNELSGEIPAELGSLTNLQRLRLQNNQLTGPLPLTLSALSQLLVLNIQSTTLCAPTDTAFQAWLATINFQGSVCGTRTPGGGGGGGGPRTSAPGAVRNLMAVGGDGQVVLTWRAPESDGGAEITDYEYRINGRNPWISIGSTDTTHTVTGLVNGTEYTFQVRAVNRVGKSFAPSQVEAAPEEPEVLTLDFTHFVNGNGTTSDLVFVNVAPQPVRPAIYFYDTEGNPIAAESVVDITGDLEISEDGGLTVLTEMEPLGELTIPTHGQGELVSGSVKVISSVPIGGMLRFDLPGIGEAVVGASQPVSDALFPVRRQEGGITTGVAIHNLEEEAMEVVCELMQEGVLRDAVSLPLEANGQTAWLIDAAFPAADTSDFVGSVQCDAGGEGLFSAVALEMDPGARVFITLPLFPVNRLAGGRAAVLDFAHFANGDGITSEMVFVNVSTQRSRPAPTPFHTDIPPIRPAIYFYDTEGHPIAAESVVDVTGDLEITEDGGLTVQTQMKPLGVLTVSTHGQGPLVTGSVRVVSEAPIGGMLRYDLPHIGVAVVEASPPISDAIFPVRRQEGGITTGVAIHNLESSPGLVHCDLMREGVLRDAASFPLEANGQTSWLIDQAFPATDTSDFAGSVRCDAVGEGRFSAVALEMDPGTRVFTTLPLVPLAERMPQE